MVSFTKSFRLTSTKIADIIKILSFFFYFSWPKLIKASENVFINKETNLVFENIFIMSSEHDKKIAHSF